MHVASTLMRVGNRHRDEALEGNTFHLFLPLHLYLLYCPPLDYRAGVVYKHSRQNVVIEPADPAAKILSQAPSLPFWCRIRFFTDLSRARILLAFKYYAGLTSDA
jgi:hypothetical protein